MCFSTEASFTAAFVLGAIGYTTLKMSFSRPQLFLAAIPCLFAIQQFSEGILWFTLGHHLASSLISWSAERIFLAFAFLIWPIWVPFSLVMIEKVAWRRNILYANLACGIALALLNVFYAMKQDISVQIINHSLQYRGYAPPQSLLYPLIVLLPCFISSYRYIWIFGMLVAISYAVADYYYQANFVSIWCFFASFVSIVLYKIIKENQADAEKTKQDKLT